MSEYKRVWIANRIESVIVTFHSLYKKFCALTPNYFKLCFRIFATSEFWHIGKKDHQTFVFLRISDSRIMNGMASNMCGLRIDWTNIHDVHTKYVIFEMSLFAAYEIACFTWGMVISLISNRSYRCRSFISN